MSSQTIRELAIIRRELGISIEHIARCIGCNAHYVEIAEDVGHPDTSGRFEEAYRRALQREIEIRIASLIKSINEVNDQDGISYAVYRIAQSPYVSVKCDFVPRR